VDEMKREEKNMKQCHKCGSVLDDNAVFCNNCGAKVEAAVKTVEAEAPVVQQPQQPVIHKEEQPAVPAKEPQQPELIKCNYCGEMVPSDLAVCSKCGAQLKYSKQANVEARAGDFITSNAAKLKKAGEKGINSIVKAAESEQVKGILKDRKKLMMIAIPVAAVLLVLLIISSLLSGGSAFDTYGKKAISYVVEDGSVSFFTSGKVVAEIDEDLYQVNLNLNHTKAALLTDYDSESGGNLYIVSASGEKLIDEDVWKYAIADSGNGIVYLKDYDYDDDTATVMLYNGSKSKVISDEASGSSFNGYSLVISPDGKSVAYFTYDDEPVGYISKNGQSPKEIGEYQICFALSNDAKYVYYMETDEDSYETNIYVKKGSKENKLISNSGETFEFSFNKSYSQAIFSYDNKTYITVDGKDKQKIAGASSIYLLSPNNSQVVYNNSIVTYGVKSFAGKMFMEDNEITYMNNKFDTNKVADDVNYVSVSADLKTVVYSDYSGNLKVVSKVNSKNPKEKELDKAEDVMNFTITKNADKIYYVNEDEELCVISQKNKSKKIADDASGYYLSVVGNKLFFLTDYNGEYGTLCYTTGSKKQKVKDAEDVSNMFSLGGGLIYYNGDYDESSVYGSPNGSKFKLFLEDLNTY
jgi:uncharacterized OB-fold protein